MLGRTGTLQYARAPAETRHGSWEPGASFMNYTIGRSSGELRANHGGCLPTPSGKRASGPGQRRSVGPMRSRKATSGGPGPRGFGSQQRPRCQVARLLAKQNLTGTEQHGPSSPPLERQESLALPTLSLCHERMLYSTVSMVLRGAVHHSTTRVRAGRQTQGRRKRLLGPSWTTKQEE